MLGIIIAFVAAIPVVIWYFFIRPLSYWTRLGVKQSKPCIFVGDSGFSIFKQSSFNDFVAKIYNMHPGTRYSGFYTFNKPVLLIKDPELIKLIQVKEFEHFTDHVPFVDSEADPFWSNTLIALKGERWKEIRTTLTPTFTSAKIKNIFILISETATNFVKHFLEKEDDIVEIEMKDAFSRFTNDIIATAAFGLEVDSLKEETNTFFDMGKNLTNFSGLWFNLKFFGHQLCPKLMKYLGIGFLDKTASKYFSDVVNETIKVREERNIVRNDVLNLMLEARQDNDKGKSKVIKMSNDEIASQAMIFFFAGFDTVSTAMSFASYELALNKEVQDRLREEIMQTQNNGTVTYDQLIHMKYMDMVLSEVLRKWPPLPSLDRICTKPFTIKPINEDEKPLHLRANQEIWIPAFGIHMDPKYFPDPDQFDPERFSDENKNNIVPYSYMPFGLGPRTCIGNRLALLEVKALLFNVLVNYEIVPTKKTQIPLKLAKDFSQMPENGFWVGLKRLKN